MKPVLLKDDEIVVKMDDFGWLVETWVKKLLDYNPYVAEGEHGTDARLRKFWPMLEEYYQRHIQCDIEVAIMLDDPPRPNRQPLQNKELWQKFIDDHRPPKSPFTVDYSCSQCKKSGIKLWRKSHTFANCIELVCAKCAVPDIEVDEDGRAERDDFGKTDQIGGWLVPAVPVGDTYWGYTSVPSQDVEWWRKLPTYK